MLAYRHAFHVGNPADVLKHIVLLGVLERMAAKDKAYWYIDTHAGAGSYQLADRMAQRLAEYQTGIGLLWGRKDMPSPVAAYVKHIRTFNAGGELRTYPGSPALAGSVLRPQDRMRLFELHTTDFRLLDATWGQQPHVEVRNSDGFAGLKAMLPPPTRRGVVLIDPSYELDSDYGQLVAALRDAITRFATGVYCVWYPQLQSLESIRLPKRLKALSPAGWMHAQLSTAAPRPDGFGLMGSGMFVINPPFGLQEGLKATLPWLARTLGQDGAGRHVLEGHTP
ncbi:Ribosomal RNA large subunit methyltransferase J [Thiomonas sp. X19]|uniref:23S rRNA (adenine(2030)-N(6))-methyltransferase RlmJ n=1 Tax=Thiomonas sp. X19 TaxID=1050370 RepID=UPI000B76683C|nr:23S rRNA (adenine(2030)-N(6))-methyltransferase RlmJ [Thiomonas sp. X19]SCC92384.1 Ribosomal RNA large subunit methyltransferase J [Thiomonas sp. X19]